MIWTVWQVNVRRLLHNPMELLLTFIVPIAFFSIFAVIFGGGVGIGTTPKIKVIALDQWDSEISRALVNDLTENQGLRFMRSPSETNLTTEEAKQLVRRGNVGMAMILKQDGDNVAVELLTDSSDQVAAQLVTAIVTESIVQAKVEQQQQSIRFAATSIPPGAAGPIPGNGAIANPVQVVDVIGEGKSNPVVSMYAAGIAVMFLLFGATGGGGALLEERENQTLERLLSTRLTMDQLLLGKWFYMTAIGTLQMLVMFAWAQLVFGVDLVGHFDGFLIMTLVTALAASAFGLFLATACRTRGQLSGISVVLVLTMSALGGSMVPRYVMSENLQQYGLCTFNAWALDGFDKVFWRELPVEALAPQLAVLLISGIVMLLAARILAIRWELD
ncbi:ABC transporter permease [Rubripirellula sp.]|nr:ABC transporter permease [Planctomycetaceae bacterium]MDA9857764.1 ABC transporter permease [Rubripirellula sp.]